MKNFSILFALLFFYSIQLSATVLQVNNLSPSPGEYTTLQSAVNAATAGDTLYMAGTGINYGGVSVDKQLTIIGPGFVVAGSTISGVAQAGIISLTSVNASGFKVIGIRFFQLISTDAAVSLFSNITVQRCLVDDCLFLSNDDWTGCLVEGNVFTSVGPNTTASMTTANIIASTIRNNVFNGTLYYTTTDIIEQNFFAGTNNGNTPIISGATGNTFQNNIAVGRNCATVDATSNCTGNMNYLCFNPNFPGTGNYLNTNPMFVSYTSGVFSWTHDYHLAIGSPALGAGAGGLDIGLYGGDGIYRKDHEPDIPIVRFVSLPDGNVVPANSTFTINVVTSTHE